MKKLFGKRLRELRIQRKLTQEKIAEDIGIKPENYCRIENGLSFPKPDNIERISKILNVDISELFNFDHFQEHEKLTKILIDKINSDNETAIITYKFLKSIGKII